MFFPDAKNNPEGSQFGLPVPFRSARWMGQVVFLSLAGCWRETCGEYTVYLPQMTWHLRLFSGEFQFLRCCCPERDSGANCHLQAVKCPSFVLEYGSILAAESLRCLDCEVEKFIAHGGL